jgi:hypothetical protein
VWFHSNEAVEGGYMKCKHILIYVICGLDLVMCFRVGSRLCIQQYFVIRFASEVVMLLVHCAMSLVDRSPTFRDSMLVSLSRVACHYSKC